jgi:hypothetical protein
MGCNPVRIAKVAQLKTKITLKTPNYCNMLLNTAIGNVIFSGAGLAFR